MRFLFSNHGSCSPPSPKGCYHNSSRPRSRRFHCSRFTTGDIRCFRHLAFSPKSCVASSNNFISPLPFQTIVKAGYPPHVLTIIPELPLASLGLKSGDQLIVSELPGTGGDISSSNPEPSSSPSAGRSSGDPSVQSTHAYTPSIAALNTPASTSPSPDYVDTDGGVLIHRVSLTRLTMI